MGAAASAKKKPNPTRRIERRSRRGVFQAFLSTARRKGGGTTALVDGDGRKFTYTELSRAALALSGPISRMTKAGETVGVFLPTGAGAVIAIFALHARGRVPAMLNFTSGVANLASACKAARVTKVITAHKFIEVAKLHDLAAELEKVVRLVYLEDLREDVTNGDKARALVGPLAPPLFAANPNPDSPGVILFTSGTEGKPKGVVLSHANILANIEQIYAHVEIHPTDVFFNPLPVFHCYGLTAGTLWPLIAGFKAVMHPSPLQTKIIAKRIFETSSTVLFATDTFLQQYMRASGDGGLNSLRIAVCGAERVREETRQLAARRFSFEVLEGYGVTECSPVLAANQPGDIRGGTIGKMLPAVDYRIEPVPGLDDAGRLVVRGPNVMRGYISESAPGVLRPPPDGWHDTGDVVSIDKEGYVTIRGRLKRFAKIGGEMISLTVVENCAAALWPSYMHAAAILPDKRKGEQIVLVTENPDADPGALLTWAQSHGVPEIAVPKKIVTVEALPVLGTGKVDYVKVTEAAKAAVAPSAEASAPPAPTANAAPAAGPSPDNAADQAEDAATAEQDAATAAPDAQPGAGEQPLGEPSGDPTDGATAQGPDETATGAPRTAANDAPLKNAAE
ncbi:MAG: AMP-binding protein [Pseudomonadota bacterium]